MGLFSSTKHEERAHNFATEFLRVSGPARMEMIASLYRNSNRVLLIPRARRISEELRNRKAAFQAIYDFETGLARTAHPGRRWHPGAQYFYAAYFKERAGPYRTALHNLSAGGQLSGAGLVPLLARMDHSDGRSFVLLFIEEILRPLNPALAGALKAIEVDHHRLKDALAGLQAPEDSIERRVRRVGEDFQKFCKEYPDLAKLYLLRAEADRVLEPYVAALRRSLAAADEAAASQEPGTTPEISSATVPPGKPDDLLTDPGAEEDPAAIPANITSEELTPEAIADAADAAVHSETTANTPPPDETAPVQPISSSQTHDVDAGDDIQETPEGALEADLTPEPEPESEAMRFDASTAQTSPAAIAPADASNPVGAGPEAPEPVEAIEDSHEFQEFLAARRAEMEDIERRLHQDLEECQQEIQAIASIADPAERVDESSAALLGDDQYRHFRVDLQEILADADGLFARIFALLSKLARRLTVAEMRRFVDHLIEELSQDEAIREREPHLIPRLVNYRNSLKEDAPRLLNQIHARLAEIRREEAPDEAATLRTQLEYLQARLTDPSFRGIWPTIFTIYQNLVAQQFDAQVFREISEHLPLERQQRMLASLRAGFREGGPARAAIDRRLRGAELAGIGERIQREDATGESEELGEILARLESNHSFDPVERVRQEIRDFDAGLSSSDETVAGAESKPAEAQTPTMSHGDREERNDAEGHDDAHPPLQPHQESGWTVERTRALLRSQPAKALEFAGRALSAGEVDGREKELLAEYVEELGARRPEMARLYIFHRSVESAGGPREQLQMIRNFRELLPPAVVEGRETNLRRAVARAPVPRRLNGALKESDRSRRAMQLREIMRNPHLPGGLRRALQAKRDTPPDTAFAAAFDSICISPHSTSAKIQLLRTLGALARARGWLNAERQRKLEDRIRLYLRISKANQAMNARYAPERRFFLENAAQFIQKLRAGQSPAAILEERDRQVYGTNLSRPGEVGVQARVAAASQPAPAGVASATNAMKVTNEAPATRSTATGPTQRSGTAKFETTGGAMRPRATAGETTRGHVTAQPGAFTEKSVARPNTAPESATDFDSGTTATRTLDEDFMNTPIELEHGDAQKDGAAAKKARRSSQSKSPSGRAKKSGGESSRGAPASAHSESRAGAGPGSPAGKPAQHSQSGGGFFGKLLNRVTGAADSGKTKTDGKQETISIARLTTRAEKLFLKGDRRDPQQLLDILHTPEDLLELLLAMPEMKKNPAAKRDKAAEAIKAALAVTVVIPKKNRVLGLPGSLCFPRKDWNNELKRKNLVKSLNALADKQLPGSEKYNYYKFLAEEVQFNYYQGKYKHGRI